MQAPPYVDNLVSSTSDDDLRACYAQAGAVVSIAVTKDRDTGVLDGIGFVEMTSQVDPQESLPMFNGYKLSERALTVHVATPREERLSRDGGYRV